MKRSDIDWSILRGALIALFLCLIVSGAMLGGSFYFKEAMNRDYLRNNAMFRAISNKYFAVDEEEKLIKKFYPLFIDLYNKGVIGRELRLDWIEALRNAGEEFDIAGLSYEIKSQEVYKPAYKVNLGRFKLYRSVMNLNMKLLHEGDLFRLLQALDKNAKGAYNVSACTMNLATTKISEDPDSTNVTVRCELTWHTIKLADGKELKV